MTVVACIAILICIIVGKGCTSGERPPTATDSAGGVSSYPIQDAADAAQKEHPQFLEVERFSLTKESLRLNYRVTNIFSHDIWVCTTSIHGTDQDSEFSAEREIADGTLRIRRHGNMYDGLRLFIGGSEDAAAVYHRLAPRQSRSDTILLPLPVSSFSPFRMAEGPPFSPVILTRVVLEVGYFGEDLPALLSQYKGRARVVRSDDLESSEKEPDVAFLYYMRRPNRWEGLDLEQSVEVTISDLQVPGLSGKRPPDTKQKRITP